MKRRRTLKETRKTGFDEAGPSMAPLIDVSFLLLIFFVVTATILKRERDLTMILPGPPQAEEVPLVPIVVGVEGDGSILLNPGRGEMLVSSGMDERELPVLEEHLGKVRSMAAGRDLVVQLRVAEEAYQQRVVDVLNCFANAGVHSVALLDSP